MATNDTPPTPRPVKASPRHKAAQRWLERAQERIRNGQMKGALADLARAIQADPTRATTFFVRADLYRSLGEPQRALLDYDQALALQPGMALAYIGRGNARRNLGDAAGALSDLQQAVRLQPGNPAAHVGLGLARSAQDAALALKDFARAIRLNPAYAEAYFARGLVRVGTPAAFADFNKTLALNPRHGMAQLYRGDYLSARGLDDQAVVAYGKAIELGVAETTRVYAKRAAALLKLGQAREACDDCTHALRADPELAPAYLIRGTAHFALNQSAAAITDLERAIMLDPAMKRTAGQVLDAARKYAHAKKQARKRQNMRAERTNP